MAHIICAKASFKAHPEVADRLRGLNFDPSLHLDPYFLYASRYKSSLLANMIGIKITCAGSNFVLYWPADDLFGLVLNVPVNRYGHVLMVSSTDLTYYLGKLD